MYQKNLIDFLQLLPENDTLGPSTKWRYSALIIGVNNWRSLQFNLSFGPFLRVAYI